MIVEKYRHPKAFQNPRSKTPKLFFHPSSHISADRVKFSHASDLSERVRLMTALEEAETYRQVFDDNNTHPTPNIQAIRERLKKQPISLEEMTSHPRIRQHFYTHQSEYATAEADRLEQDPKADREKVFALRMHAQIMREAADSVGEVLKPVNTFKLNTSFKAQVPKFSGLFSLYTNFWGSVIPPKPYDSRNKAERIEKARQIIHTGSALAGASAGILTKSFVGDEAALTYITVGTIMSVSKHIYGQEGVTEAALSVVAGKLLGGRIATKLVSLIPGIGEMANAATAFTLHEATAWLFVQYYENEIANKKEPKLPTDINAFLAVLGLAQLAGIDIAGDSQDNLVTAHTDALVESGQAEYAPSVFQHFMPHTIAMNGHYYSVPNQSWWFNNLVNTGCDVTDAIELAKKIANIKTAKPTELAALLSKAMKEAANGLEFSDETEALALQLGIKPKDIEEIAEVLEKLEDIPRGGLA